MSDITVAHVITDLVPGGEATIMTWLLPELRRRGIDGVVLAFAPDVNQRDGLRETPVTRALTDAGIRVVDLGLERPPNPNVLLRLASELRRIRPDVVHTYVFHAGIAGRVIGRIATRSPIVSSIVNVDAWKGEILARAEAETLRLANVVLTNAHVVAARLERTLPALRKRVVVSYNGVDLDVARRAEPVDLGLPNDLPVLGIVGRLHRAKGPDIAIEAFARLRREMEAYLMIAGTGEMEGALRELAFRRGVAAHVRFLGHTPHTSVFGLMKAFDALVISSRWEGLPAVLLEAWACGVPVVSTAMGAVPEISQDGTDAIHVPVGDPDALAVSCVRVLRDSALRSTLMEQGLTAARRFPLESMIDTRERLYRALTRPSSQISKR